MAEKSKKVVPLTEEEKYEYAKKMLKSIDCLLRNKERAEIYAYTADLFEKLGDYKDCKALAEECQTKAKEYKKLAKKDKEEAAAKEKEAAESEKTEKKSPKRKIIGILILILIAAGIAGVIYLKSDAGCYVRAAYYQDEGNYQKAYKMFKNLKDYKDSEERYIDNYSKYIGEFIEKKDFAKAFEPIRKLEKKENTNEVVVNLEMAMLNKSTEGNTVLYGKHKWLVLEKKDGKILLIKKEPVEGYAFDKSGKKNITWENSTVRKELNSSFLKDEFTEEQIINIEDTNVESNDVETTDKIFFLNKKQLEKYKDTVSDYDRDWWLIDKGTNPNTAMFVSRCEAMENGYDVSTENIYIRPAMYVNISK